MIVDNLDSCESFGNIVKTFFAGINSLNLEIYIPLLKRKQMEQSSLLSTSNYNKGLLIRIIKVKN